MKYPSSTVRGISKYMEFHDYDPKDVGVFPKSFKLPNFVERLGPALWVTYRSGKWGDGVHDYIHEHSTGTACYVPRGSITVPQRIRRCQTLVDLGRCLGFGYREAGRKQDVQLTAKHNLYCTPDGKALIVIENKRRVVVLIWGGKLRVEDRGIID